MPGVADVIILNYANAIHPVIFVELKATTKQSPTQKEFQLKVEKLGYSYIIAYTIDEVDYAITPLLKN